jgi:hypothetical protein
MSRAAPPATTGCAPAGGGARLWRARAPGPVVSFGRGIPCADFEQCGVTVASTFTDSPLLGAARTGVPWCRECRVGAGARSPTLHILPRRERARSPARCQRWERFTPACAGSRRAVPRADARWSNDRASLKSRGRSTARGWGGAALRAAPEGDRVPHARPRISRGAHVFAEPTKLHQTHQTHQTHQQGDLRSRARHHAGLRARSCGEGCGGVGLRAPAPTRHAVRDGTAGPGCAK